MPGPDHDPIPRAVADREASEADAAILHVDLDAFYASVEQLDDPELHGRPVIVGGLGGRGVVAAASYEARRFGVHSAMPMARARRACPSAAFVSPRFDRYSAKSREVMAIFESVTPLVEQLSIDEAFLDVSGARRLLGTGVEIARIIRTRVRAEAGLVVSVGVASTKFLAKLASDLSKPDGLLAVPPGTELEFLAPLPVSRLWGVGPATLRKLDRMSVQTIGEVAALPESTLTAALGNSLGQRLRALARNDDPRAVVPEREAKSIGAEETFAIDLRTREACDRELVRLADRVTGRLRDAQLRARTATLKIRFGNFETRTRARTVPVATDVSTVFLATSRELLDAFDCTRGVRLLGISLSQLEPVAEAQGVLSLDDDVSVDDARVERRAAVERAVDAVRDRFGSRSVGPASLADDLRSAEMMRIGLVGCGHIGTVHAYVLQQLSEADLVDAALTATFDADPARAARAARHHGGEPTATLPELVAGVDVVWVCTWTAAHLEAVELAVDAGKPVFCEKPLGPDAVGAERVATLLERVPHQVGLVLRWSPVFQRAAEIIAGGEFGRPMATVLRDDQYFPIQGFYGSTWRKDVAQAGGGALIEHSIHDVDVLHWLLGDPVSVSARTASRFGHPGIEDIAAVTFGFDDGSVAQLTSVWHQVLTRESGRHLEVFCEGAALWTDDDYLGPLHMQTSDGVREVLSEMPDWAGRLTVPEVYAKSIAHYGAAAKAFLDGLGGRGPGQVGGGFPGAGEALAAHRLVDRAYRSAAQGGVPVAVELGP